MEMQPWQDRVSTRRHCSLLMYPTTVLVALFILSSIISSDLLRLEKEVALQGITINLIILSSPSSICFVKIYIINQRYSITHLSVRMVRFSWYSLFSSFFILHLQEGLFILISILLQFFNLNHDILGRLLSDFIYAFKNFSV